MTAGDKDDAIRSELTPAAALRAGIKTVMLPARNKKDIGEIPPAVREQLEFVWLDTIDDAISRALEMDVGSADPGRGTKAA